MNPFRTLDPKPYIPTWPLRGLSLGVDYPLLHGKLAELRTTWTPKVCRIIALLAVVRGLRLLFDIVCGFRQPQGSKFSIMDPMPAQDLCYYWVAVKELQLP